MASGALALGAACLLAWAIAAGAWLEPRMQRRLVRGARRSWPRGAAITLAFHLAVLACGVVLLLAALVVAELAGSSRAAAFVVVPTALLLLPVGASALPSFWPGSSTPSALRRAGATRAVGYAIAWCSAPFFFLDLSLAAGALIATFA